MRNDMSPRGAFLVVPSDTAELTPPIAGAGIPCGFFANSAGTVAVLTETGDAVTFVCNAGDQKMMRIRRVMATGTTVAAGNIYATY